MGRKKIYKTKEEKHQANKEKYMRYYWKNSDKIKKKNLKRYYENKRHLQDN
jgi:hypothetical protein